MPLACEVDAKGCKTWPNSEPKIRTGYYVQKNRSDLVKLFYGAKCCCMVSVTDDMAADEAIGIMNDVGLALAEKKVEVSGLYDLRDEIISNLPEDMEE